MAIDDALSIYSTGYMAGSQDFDPGPGFYTLSTPSESPFVLKLGPCANVTQAVMNVTDCNSYTLNNKTYDQSGTYTQTVPNSSGCYTIITLNLTLNKKFTQQSKPICDGESFFAGGKNQTQSGTYVDTLQTWQGCDSIVTTVLTVNPNPVPDLGPDKYLCSDNPQLVVSPGSFASYSWQDLGRSGSRTITTPGTYWVEVFDGSGCNARDTLVVLGIAPTPANFLKPIDSLCTYDGLDIRPSGTYSSYQWSTGENTGNLMVQQPGIYWLTVTSAKGCSGTDSITVIEKRCITDLYVPSGFSPNGDGKNDVFKPVTFRPVKKYRFAIFNRWGAEVFESSDVQKGWDGKIGGELQPAGVFVWICYFQFEGSEMRVEKGTVMMVR